MIPIRRLVATLAFPIILGGCVSGAEYAGKQAGFSTVSATTRSVVVKDAIWVQNQEQAKALTARTKVLLSREKTLGVETAVQIALINNKGLQAAYADLGDSAADAWQATMLLNPTASVGLKGIGTPELEAFRTIEGALTANILALITKKRDVALADTRFEQAQLNAALATLGLAANTRRAWITAVAADENVAQLQIAQTSADAASELAEKLGETGGMAKGAQAREHAFAAELAGETAKARLAARLAKEDLTRLLGLWGADTSYRLPNRLPSLPKTIAQRDTIEANALRNRIDLKVARLELEASAQSYGLTEATRYVTDLELVTGLEAERSREDGVRKVDFSGSAEIGFAIPIFDTGKARMRKAELAYMRSANQLAEKAVTIRSQARSAYQAYRSSLDIARHYRNNVVPLRSRVAEQSLLTYNGMITNTFELLTDTREKINATLLSVNARRDFWLADANLAPAIYGGGPSSAAAEPAMAAGSDE
ncbi:TolC family protein [Rhizobium lusitanum]|uniref:Outer membrane protein TolC n=1 Tax=Rhizobium lusitanum TaxID=293958 RepID=A0A7X0IS31_9HYPH|nr:TolC family protein [Rhizobium lusitanum]MBB6486120.1 outer membrane protein TolC [Rhizobium lusitanum]